MPVVLSYEAVEGLGALAAQSGRSAGQAQADTQRMQMTLDRQSQMDQTATQLQDIEAQQRMQQQELAFQGQQAAADRRLEEQQFNQEMGLHRDELAAGLQERQLATRGDLQEAQLQHQQRLQQEHLRGMYDLQRERITQQGESGPYGQGPAGAALGMPSEDFAESEMQQFGHLLPWQQNVKGASAAESSRERVVKQAQALSQLPTGQLKRMLDQGQAGEYSPYMRAVIQARQKLGDGQRLGAVGAMPEGGAAPSPQQGVQPQPGPAPGAQGSPRQSQQQPQPGGQGVAGSGQGFGESLQQLSNEELRALADNPEALQRYRQRFAQ